MDARDVIEVGALLSAHSALIVESNQPLNPEAIRRTWKESRRRVDGWVRRLHAASELARPNVTEEVLKVAREMLVSDLPARCWAAILAARADRTGDVDLESVARNILLGRLRIRRFALHWLLDDAHVTDDALAAVDRLRRRTERWTDMLTAPLVLLHDLEEFAFDAERSRDFARTEMTDPNAGLWPLLLAGIRVSFDELPHDSPRVMVENRRFIRAILACLPSQGFQVDGPFRSIRAARIRRGDPGPQRGTARTPISW